MFNIKLMSFSGHFFVMHISRISIQERDNIDTGVIVALLSHDSNTALELIHLVSFN